jgi:hypothetical protein
MEYIQDYISASAMPSGSPDPLLEAIAAFREGVVAYARHRAVRAVNVTDDEHDAAVAETFGPARDRLEAWTMPAISAAAATAALRLAREEYIVHGESKIADTMFAAVIGYIESQRSGLAAE